MDAFWLEELVRQGAVVEDGRVVSFGDPAAEARAARDGDIAVDLSHVGLVRLAGEEAGDFLQRLTTNDVSALPPARSGAGALCNPKGRVVVVFRIFRRGEEYWLATPSSMTAILLDQLTRNRFRSRVDIQEKSQDLWRIGFSGPGMADLLRKKELDIPEEPHGVSSRDNLTILRIQGPVARFVVIGAEERLRPLWETLPVRKAGAAAWTLLSMEGDLPNIYPATSQAFLPQWLNLQQWDALSFTKGCFPGQEVVARTQNLGTITRRLFRGRTVGEVPAPGTRLWEIQPEGNMDGGTLVEGVSDGEGFVRLLAVVPVAVADGSRPLRLGTEEGPLIQLDLESVEKP